MFVVFMCILSGSTAPSGVCVLNEGEGCWPLLSIKGGIDREHGSISAASQPWTADNGLSTGDLVESNQQQLGENASPLVEGL